MSTVSRSCLCVFSSFPNTGDFLRIEHTAADDGSPPSGLEDRASGFDTAVAEQEASDPATAPAARRTANAGTAPWRMAVTPCEQSIAEIGVEGTGTDGQKPEHGMVLYNVVTGTQLHVR